ncbi:MAG: hypothetical protein IPO44_03870 [Candidatus Microthrix sp.]|nr:hypothetical protein [Candidatus Microthrix sp.]MBK9558727.1 hypothetical protein [Candidatus Microthrix sp.]
MAALVGDLPEVTMEPAVAGLIPGFDQAQADAVVADVAADLTIEAEAIEAGDPALLLGPDRAPAAAPARARAGR